MRTEYTVNDVSNRLFHYYMHDVNTLRTKYFKMTQSPLGKVSKDFMCKAIVRAELGDRLMDEYNSMVDMMRDSEVFVEEEERC